MAGNSDFDEFAQLLGYLPSPADPLDKEVKPHLKEDIWGVVQRWVIDQKSEEVATPKSLTPIGQWICRQCQIEPRSRSTLENRVSNNPNFLLVLIHLGSQRFQYLIDREKYALDPWAGYRREAFEEDYMNEVGKINVLLEDGRSAWQIAWPGGGLVLRVPHEIGELFNSAQGADDIAAKHLKDAWQHAWGLESNGDNAFQSAIRALEASFGAIVIPDNISANLGNIAQALQDKPDKWTARLANHRGDAGEDADENGIVGLAKILEMLWRCRLAHGESTQYRVNNIEDARDAVSLTAALVAMQHRGFLSHRDDH